MPSSATPFPQKQHWNLSFSAAARSCSGDKDVGQWITLHLSAQSPRAAKVLREA